MSLMVRGQFSNSLPAYKPVFFCMRFHECDASSLWSERFEIASLDLGVLTAGGAALSWVSDGPLLTLQALTGGCWSSRKAEEREREERRERKKAKVFLLTSHLPPRCHACREVAGHLPLNFFTGWSPSQSEASAAGMIHKFVECETRRRRVFFLGLAQAATEGNIRFQLLLNTAG